MYCRASVSKICILWYSVLSAALHTELFSCAIVIEGVEERNAYCLVNILTLKAIWKLSTFALIVGPGFKSTTGEMAGEWF